MQKRIYQKTHNDCGIAALAMLHDCPYPKMHKMIMAMAEYDEEPFTGTPSNYARLASELLGRKLTVRYINDTNRAKVAKWLKDRPAILIVPAKGYRKNTEYHAVYWTGDRLYDPNGSRPYKIDGKRAKMRMEEVWYIK